MATISNVSEDYPAIDTLPCQKERIEARDWDVLLVYDACRWDYLTDIVQGFLDESHEPEMVRTPAEMATPDWTTQVWCSDDTDWSDLTYISGNPATSFTKELDEFGGDIEAHVGEYVEAFNDGAYDDYLDTTRPDKLTQMAQDYDPPMVVHYLQPHQPFIGNIGIQASFQTTTEGFIPDEHENVDAGGWSFGSSGIHRLFMEGELSIDHIRAAYKDNLKLVWKDSWELREAFDNVVVTADHGEVLREGEWSHGRKDDPCNRIVPWYEVDQ